MKRLFFSPCADMQAERNGLHADVFPFLTERCRALGMQFEPSDMVRLKLVILQFCLLSF